MANPLLQIQIQGAFLVIVNQQVRADLAGFYGTATWAVTAGPGGSFVFTDQASGLVLSDASTTAGSGIDQPSPAVIAPAAIGMPVSSWSLVQFSDGDGDDAAPIKDPSQLSSGYYTIQDPSSGNFLFRNRVEDRSLTPKYVGLQDPSQGPYELVIRVLPS